MAFQISDKCISCGMCEYECPNRAIYEGGMKWSIAKGTKAKGAFLLFDGNTIEADKLYPALSFDSFYIVPEKCTECQGFHDTPQCAEVCQVGACGPSDLYLETKQQLLFKKESLYS